MNHARIIRCGEGSAMSAFGDQQLLKLAAAETGNQFSVMKMDYRPGTGSGSHKHLADTHIIYVLAGGFVFIVSGQQWEVSVGDLLYIPQNIFHSFKADAIIGGEMLVITLPAGLEQFFIECHQQKEQIDIHLLTRKYRILTDAKSGG